MKIIPVIHHIDEQTTLRNADLCSKHNAFGLFLISMEGNNDGLCALAKRIKIKFPNLKVGVNLLGVSAKDSVYESLNYSLDMTWSDNPIVTGNLIFNEAYIIEEDLKSVPEHLFFNSVAFKYQKKELNIPQAVLNSKNLNFIPTTSGDATGVAADLSKIKVMKETLKDYPLAIASGLTPENIHEYLSLIEFGLVATGISKDFHNFDEEKLNFIINNS